MILAIVDIISIYYTISISTESFKSGSSFF